MKTTKPIFLFILLLIASCKQDDPVQQGTVQFSINHLTGSSFTGRKQTDEIPDGSSLILTLSKSNGDSVFNWKKISLLKIGSQFITPPLPLLQGSYSVDDFIIVGPDNTVLFITPKKGSSLSSLVSHATPITFNVSTNNISNIDVEVIEADHGVPEEFGYASFPLKIVTPDLSISLFTAADNGDLVFTDGHAIIMQGLDTVFQKDVTSSINGLNWHAQANGVYQLVIIKNGYARYTKDFRFDLLKNELAGKPLAIVLQPAFTIMWSAYLVTSPPTFSPNLTLSGLPGTKLRIDWGDGITENLDLPDYPTDKEFDHTYSVAGNYFVSVTGDINAMKEIGIKNYTATIHSMSLQHLPALTYFFLNHQIIRTGTIDFSHNPQLINLFMQNDIGLTSLDISHNKNLFNLNIAQNKLPTPVVDKIIDDLYASVVLLGTRGGSFSLINSFTYVMVGPPSPDRLEKLASLERDYGWYVYPSQYHH